MQVHKRHYSAAFTLVEIALVLLLAALLFTTVRPAYKHLVDEAKSESTKSEIEEISDAIDDFYDANGFYPDSLDEVFSPPPLDPWGNPYQFLKIEGGGAGLGEVRKDRNLVPINSDYDLYSMGPDGKSVPPLTANASRDDIVRGRNGDFFGPATEY